MIYGEIIEFANIINKTENKVIQRPSVQDIVLDEANKQVQVQVYWTQAWAYTSRSSAAVVPYYVTVVGFND